MSLRIVMRPGNWPPVIWPMCPRSGRKSSNSKRRPLRRFENDRVARRRDAFARRRGKYQQRKACDVDLRSKRRVGFTAGYVARRSGDRS